MKNILQKLFEYQTLTTKEAKEAMLSIAKGMISPEHLVSIITVYQMRPITVDELIGFKEALLEACIPVDLSNHNTIDVCGTGGDGKNTFNISTLSAFVLAGANAKVSKHGNYGVSSVSGSSNVLEYLQIKFTTNQDKLNYQLDKANICFLHAPLFHPALKEVAAIRKQLAFKTFFNMLGPLVNPAKPNNQLTGVYSLELARLYSYVFQQTNCNYSILYSLDSYDEISLTAPFKVLTKNMEKIVNPIEIGFAKHPPAAISGGQTIKDAAEIFIKVLSGNGTTSQNNVVIANTAFALQCYSSNLSIEQAIEKAEDSLFSGRAYQQFKTLQTLN